MLARVAGLQPRPFGTPISLPAGNLWQLYRIPFYCNDSADCEIILNLPENLPEPKFARPAIVESDGRRLRIGFMSTGGRWDLMRWIRQLREPLAALPDETRLEAVFADAEGSQEGRQRWAGVIRAGEFQIEAAWPSVPREVAQAALKFSVSVDGHRYLTAGSAEEADAVLDRLEDDLLFLSHPVRREGLRLFPDDPKLLLEQLAIHIFQVRFEGVWPFVSIVEDAGEMMDFGPFGLASPRFQREMERALASADNETVVFEVGPRRYRSKDLGELGPGTRPVLEPADGEFAQAGWRLLGNLALDQMPGLLVRAYALDGSDSILIMYFSIYGPAGRDLGAYFDDGSSLTSSTTFGLRPDEPEKKIYRRPLRPGSVAELMTAHQNAVSEQARTRGVHVLPPPATLAELAQAIDEFLVRSGDVKLDV